MTPTRQHPTHKHPTRKNRGERRTNAPQTGGFGAKGAGERAQTLAEQLLTGKPLGRAARPQKTPRLKARPKPVFGRGGHEGVPARSEGAVDKRGPARKSGWMFWLSLAVVALLGVQAMAAIFDWPSPTLGGRQLWTDIRVQGGWRVQCHVWTGHCRLLDGADVRHTWGREDKVLTAFDARLDAGVIPPAKSRAVVLIHGLGRSHRSFDALAADFAQDGYEVVAFDYASMHMTVDDAARALERVVGALDGVTEVHAVTHSLGALVLRTALADGAAELGGTRLGRTVLIAGPNTGSAVAARLAAFAPMRWLFGPALTTLADADHVGGLPVPGDFATVAGTRNPLWFLDQPGDGLVTTAEARLAGTKRHLEVEAAHTFIMNHADVRAFARDFIQGG